MAEFGPSVTEAPQTPNFVTPKPGVETGAAGIEGLTNIFAGVRELRKTQKASAAEKNISSFTNKQLAIVQAVDQGKMNSQFGRTQMRANLMQMINDYPSLRKEIISANAGIIGAGGMGSVIDEGTKAEIREENLRSTMVSQGLVQPDASEEQFQQAKNNFMLAAEAKRRYDAEMETLSMQAKKIGITTSQMELIDKKRKQAAESYLVNEAPARMEQFKNTADSLLSLVGTEGYDEGTVISLIEERFNQFESELRVPLSQTDSSTRDALMKGYRDYKDIVVKRAKGEYTQEAYKRQIARITTQQEMVALNNPIISKAVALSNLGLNDLLLPEQLQVSEAAAQFLSTNLDTAEAPANLFTDSSTGRKALDAYFKTIGQSGAELTDEQKSEQAQHLSRIFDGVEDYESFIQRNPEKAIGMVTDWMSTQDFYKLRQENPEAFANSDTAMRILQANYGDEVWGMIDREFTKNNIVRPQVGTMEGTLMPQVSTQSTPTAEAVSYRSTSGGMEFFAMDKNDPAAVTKAKRLNKELAPIINKNLKAFAHLEGSNDYKGYWDRIDEQYMNSAFDSDQAGGDTGDDLTLDSFVQGISAVEPVDDTEIDSSFIGKIDGRGFKDTGTMSKVEGMIIHHTGGRGDVGGVANTLVERDASVQFVIDREGKVHQLMPDNQKAWHAGKNNKSGYDNNNTVGVEIIARDDSDILPIQVETAKRLIKRMSDKYGFDPMTNVFGHGEVATHKRPTEGKKVTSTIRGMGSDTENFSQGPSEQEEDQGPEKFSIPEKTMDTALEKGLHPFNPETDTPKDVGLGGVSTEYLITVPTGDGGWMNIPSIWWNSQGSPMLMDEETSSGLARKYEEKTGKKFPRFEDMEQAVEWAKERSSGGGASHEELAK